MNKYKICVYAICKNEEKFVDRWYNTVKEADKVIVLDVNFDKRMNILAEANTIDEALNDMLNIHSFLY